MDSKNIEITYRNARIRFDAVTEEWVAHMNTEFKWEWDSDSSWNTGNDEFKRHISLQKLKDSIDRFNKRNFKPIPILMFDGNERMRTAEIISFTEILGECWIRREDDRRELIKTINEKFAFVRTIYACENINNEPILTDINLLNDEIDRIEINLQKKKAERTRLIYNLQPFDISGLVISPDEDIVI